MKILKIILVVLLILIVILLIGAYVFIKTFDINRYKQKIIQQISENLGRKVDFNHIDLQLSLREGVGLAIRDLRIADDPQFSSNDFLKVDAIKLGVDILAFLKDKKILVSSVQVKSPKIVIIRDKNGQVNVQQFDAIKSQIPTNQPEGQSPGNLIPGEDLSSPDAAEDIPELLIEAIGVEDGTMTYIDRSFEPEMILEVSHIGLNIDRFSLNKPFPFKIQAALWSPVENVQIEGKTELKVTTTQMLVKDVEISTDLAQLDMKAIQNSLRFLKGVGFPEKLKGQLQLEIKELVLGPAGLIGLSANGELKDGMMKLKELTVPLDSIECSLKITSSSVDINKISLNLGQGAIRGQGNIKDYWGQQGFQYDFAVENINLEEIINQNDQPIKLQGKVFGHLKGQGQGFAGVKILPSLTAEGTMEIKEGRLKDINVLRTVLGKISMLPDLVERIEKNLPERYKEKLKQDDTVLNKVQIETNIGNSTFVLKSAQVDADGFLLEGKGQMGFDQNIDLDTSLFIPNDLSASMVASVPELQYLTESDQRIRIPVRVSGQLPALSFAPDLEYLGKKIIVNKGKEELEKVLDKVFGGDDPSGSSNQGTTPPDGQNPPGGEEQKPPERVIIENILDKIFK